MPAGQSLNSRAWEVVFQKAMGDFKGGIYTRETVGPMIIYASGRKEYTGPWEKVDKALLGPEPMTDEE
jgi:hypothetical protein